MRRYCPSCRLIGTVITTNSVLSGVTGTDLSPGSGTWSTTDVPSTSDAEATPVNTPMNPGISTITQATDLIHHQPRPGPSGRPLRDARLPPVLDIGSSHPRRAQERDA